MPRVVLASVAPYMQHDQIGIPEMLLQPRSCHQHLRMHLWLRSVNCRGERRYHCQHRNRCPHSVLSKTVGSSFAIRVSGRNDDAIATTTSSTADTAKVTESRGKIPYTSLAIGADISQATAAPQPNPATMMAVTRVIIEPMTLRGVAPSAMRMPISCLRSETSSVINPLIPDAVIASASPAKILNNNAVFRRGASESLRTSVSASTSVMTASRSRSCTIHATSG